MGSSPAGLAGFIDRMPVLEHCRSLGFAPYEQKGFRVSWILVERTAGRSTTLRSGRDDNSFVTLTFPIINLRDVHCSVNVPRASQIAPYEQAGLPVKLGAGGENCRSLGFARDDKGDGSAPIEGSGASDMSPDAVHSSLNLPLGKSAAPNDTGGAVDRLSAAPTPDFLSRSVTPRASCGFPYRKPHTLVSPVPLAGNPGTALGSSSRSISQPFPSLCENSKKL